MLPLFEPKQRYLASGSDDVTLFVAEAQKRVEEMERERQKLDRQLDLAQEKSKKANIGQEVLEAKMKVGLHQVYTDP